MTRLLVALLGGGLVVSPAGGTEEGRKAKRLELMVGESTVVTVEKPKTVVIGDPAIATVRTLSDKEILVSGRAAGLTSLIIRPAEGEETSWQIVVAEPLPERPMVEVNVQVYEIRKAGMEDLGMDWTKALQAASASESSIPPLFQIGTLERPGKIELALRALVKKGQAKVLAKPRLATVSGSRASFLSGGEVPVVWSDLQRTHIEYKPYGVGLDIQPTADAKGTIQMELRAEVSGLDPAQAVAVGASRVPALRTRWAKTTVAMKKGVTLVIAGLLHTEESRTTTGVPVLSDIPLLGELFKTTHSETEDTELVIFVTPTLVGTAP